MRRYLFSLLKMTFRVTEKHWELIINFMEQNKDLAVGRLNCTLAREQHKKLWDNLTNELNALGFGHRRSDKWQKTWTDFKYSLKKKASMMRQEIEATVGGPSKKIVFSNIEERALQLLGKTFHQGLNIPEIGLHSVSINIGHVNEEQLNFDYGQEILSDSFTTIRESTSPASRFNESEACTSKRALNDHNYTPLPKRKKLSTDEVCQQSLEEFKNIHNTLSMYLPKVI